MSLNEVLEKTIRSLNEKCQEHIEDMQEIYEFRMNMDKIPAAVEESLFDSMWAKEVMRRDTLYALDVVEGKVQDKDEMYMAVRSRIEMEKDMDCSEAVRDLEEFLKNEYKIFVKPGERRSLETHKFMRGMPCLCKNGKAFENCCMKDER